MHSQFNPANDFEEVSLPANPPSYEESQAAYALAHAAMLEGFNQPIQPSAPPEEFIDQEQHQRVQQAFLAQQRANSPVLTPEELKAWYESDLEKQQQEALQRQYRELLKDEARFNARFQNEYLRQRFHARRCYCESNPYLVLDTLDDFLLMQCLTHDLPVLIDLQWRFNFYVLTNVVDTAVRTASLVGDLGYLGVRSAGNMTSGFSSGGSGSGKGEAELLLAIAAAIVLFSAAVAGAFGAYYSALKTQASLSNLVNGEKIGKSLTRFVASLGGATAGFFGGVFAGAMLGTLISPGAGSVIGALIGAFAGAGIVSGLSVFITKYAMQAASLLFYGSTNPNKYALTSVQEQRLANYTESYNSVRINAMLKDIQVKKPGKGMFASTEQHTQNQEYNELLKAVKNKVNVGKDGFYFTKSRNTLFRWNNEAQAWVKLALRPQAPNAGFRP